MVSMRKRNISMAGLQISLSGTLTKKYWIYIRAPSQIVSTAAALCNAARQVFPRESQQPRVKCSAPCQQLFL